MSVKHDLVFWLCSILLVTSLWFSFLVVFIILWISVLLEHRHNSDRYSKAWTKKTRKIKSCDASGISPFVPIAFREKLIAVTPRCTREPAQSRLLIPAEMLPMPVRPVAPSPSGYQSPALPAPGLLKGAGLGGAGRRKDALSFAGSRACGPRRSWQKQLLQPRNDKCTGVGNLPKGTGPR